MSQDLSYYPGRSIDHRQAYPRFADHRSDHPAPADHRAGHEAPADRRQGIPRQAPTEQPSPAARPSASDARTTPNIADRFADLLAPLSPRRRRGLIARIAVGYYEGWRPTRAEVAELVAQELRRSPR
jgi:hypothetical protein